MWCVDHPRSGFAGRVLTIVALLSALAGCTTVSRPVEAVQAAAPSAVAPVVAPAVAEPKPAAPVVAPIAAATRARFGRALQAQIAGRHEDALRQWNELALAHPELGGVHANIGLIHRQTGHHAEAVAALERAVQASPTQPRFFNELGIAYRSNGQFAKSQQAYESALALDPNHAAAVLNLGILHDLYLGNGAKALELYERYLALAPGGDAAVTKWATDLRNRKPALATQATQAAPINALGTQVAKSGKEQP